MIKVKSCLYHYHYCLVSRFQLRTILIYDKPCFLNSFEQVQDELGLMCVVFFYFNLNAKTLPSSETTSLFHFLSDRVVTNDLMFNFFFVGAVVCITYPIMSALTEDSNIALDLSSSCDILSLKLVGHDLKMCTKN